MKYDWKKTETGVQLNYRNYEACVDRTSQEGCISVNLTYNRTSFFFNCIRVCTFDVGVEVCELIISLHTGKVPACFIHRFNRMERELRSVYQDLKDMKAMCNEEPFVWEPPLDEEEEEA